MSVFIIAEAGVNHGGDIQEAMRLCVAAKRCGASAVKFQHFNSRRLWGDDRIAALELDASEMANLKWQCDSLGIEFLCTPFDSTSFEEIRALLKRVKIASGCIARYPLLEAIPPEMPVILSTGMSTLGDINAALNTLDVLDRPGDITLLHCTSAYPCRVENANLRAMLTMRAEYSLPVGYSDHTQGVTVAIAAAALGATIIEKHLTLDRNAVGPDHKTSIEPEEFRVMVSAIRTVEQALGDGQKRVLECEKALRSAWRGN